ELLGFRTDEVLEQSLSRFISPEETREFTAALREVIERGATRNARLNPRSASGEVISTTLNASALRRADGKVIGAIGILRDMREFTAALREVIERGVIRNTRLNPRSASGEVIPTSLNASALRHEDGKVIGAIGILRDMRELDKALAYSDSLIKNAPDPVFVSDL